MPFSRDLPACAFSTLTVLFDFAHQRYALDASIGGALRFGGVAFPAHFMSQLTLNFKPSKTRLERIRNFFEQPRSN